MLRTGLISLCCLALAAQSTAPPPISVCDVLAKDPTLLNGRLIKIRGIFMVGAHGSVLAGECKTHLVTKGLAWANDLTVHVDPSNENTERSWASIGEKVKRFRPRGVSLQDRIWITVVGRLETRASMDDEVVETPFGLARAGFGQGGQAPAEINVISVEDVTVERLPARPRQQTTLKRTAIARHP
jgi:hypothetical protein